MSNEEEVWRVYPDIPWIEASSLGKARTKDRWVKYKNGSKRLYRGHILKQYLQPNGYLMIRVSTNGKRLNLYVHRIIASSFLPNPNNYPEVNHIDCDRTNNRVDNLEWCTRQENITYRDKLGHWVNNNPGRPVIAINPETSEVFWFESQCEAAHQLGVYQSNINNVIKGKRNTTGSYWFCEVDENTIEKARTIFGDEIAEKVGKLISENKKV